MDPGTKDKASRRLSYSHGTANIPLLPYTIGQMFNKTSEEYPDNEMYVFYSDKERFTFREFKIQTHRFAAGLLHLGLQRGDKVAILGLTHMEYMLTYHACAQIGLIFVRLIPPVKLETNVQRIKKLGCKAVVITRTPESQYSDVCKLVAELSESEPGKLSSKSFPDLKIVIAAGEHVSKCKGVLTLKDVIQLGGSPIEACDQITSLAWSIDAEDEFTVLFTSGSTGTAKAIVHTHKSVLNFVRMGCPYRRGTSFKQDWITKCVVMDSSAFLLYEYDILNPIIQGCTTVFPAPEFEPDAICKAVHEERCTEAAMVIVHMYDLVNHPDVDKYDWSCMKVIMVGGSIIPDALTTAVKTKLAEHVMLIYGSTEMCGVFLQSPTDHPDKLATGAVFPNPHTEVKIADSAGQIVPTNTKGEIYTGGYATFQYYIGDKEATQNSKTKSGWFKTGDLGIMDDDGFFRILGRKKECIMKSARELFPKELEEALDENDKVSKAVVFGVPDERFLEEVCVCIKLNEPGTLNAEDLRSFCKGKVDPMLVPRYVFFVSEFPTTHTGKFNRKKLREWAIDQLKN